VAPGGPAERHPLSTPFFSFHGGKHQPLIIYLSSSSVLQLLHSTGGSQVLARRLYRTYAHEDSETIFSDDLRHAFDNDDEAEAAFTMFDKDLNGDISMEELEAVCVEIGRERKAITASLKDLDSVVSKLDGVFLFIVAVITILVFVSLISTSAQTAITSLGSTVLALSWLFSATAQEFLQSCIFVFVKHPFDVGDRVTIYGNTGSLGRGDDYFVKEISLLYTEFKKMEGHVVQAPNNYLNTLFILNQRRSGGLAEAVPVTVKFGTTLEQIESLRNRLLEFVTAENREYQKNILTELTTIFEAYSITLNIVFFYKSNWQNELLRLQRRNKFICAMMVTMQELGIEGPRIGQVPGANQHNPIHLHGAYPPPYTSHPENQNQSPGPGPGPRTGSLARETSFVPPASDTTQFQPALNPHPTILRHRDSSSSRKRGESISQMGRRVDFSLGMQGQTSSAAFGDVYDDPKPRLPNPVITTTSPSHSPAAPGRSSSKDARNSEEGEGLAKTFSRESQSQLRKISSLSSSQRTHRNRFFGRARSKLGTAEEGTDLDDLESGTFGIGDMPDIPEASGTNTAGGEWSEKGGDHRASVVAASEIGFGTMPAGRGRSISPRMERRRGTEGNNNGRIDPRTGIVSPLAVVGDSVLERGELPVVRRVATEGVARRVC
jgi:small-conductance mechanosensitive channel